jgi:RsiW-degrading membrane proteinase PrsW (M82 family)
MEPNPYESPRVAGKPAKAFPWFRVIFGSYVVCAIVVYGYSDYRTANTPYNNSTGSVVIWSFIGGGVMLWFVLAWLFVERDPVT